MNAFLTSSDRNFNNSGSRPIVVPLIGQPHQPRRERDFGVGYGKSSGYAAPRPYIADNGPRLFRCA